MLASNQSHHIICFIFLSYIILLHHYLCQGGYTFICSSVMYCITTAYTYFKVSGSRNCMKDSLSLLGGGLHCASAVLLFCFFPHHLSIENNIIRNDFSQWKISVPCNSFKKIYILPNVAPPSSHHCHTCNVHLQQRLLLKSVRNMNFNNGCSTPWSQHQGQASH